MEKKIYRIISIAFISVSLITSKTSACGWYEDEDGYRISAFRPQTDILLAYRAFYYTPKLLNGYLPSYLNPDRYKNCEEWKKILGKDIRTEDIFTLLYKVNPNMFLLAYKDNKLAATFEGNTFIKQLLLKKNKEWLEYFAFAKRNEFNNEYLSDPWHDTYEQKKGSISGELIDEALLKLKKVKNKIVKERYAYHLIRLYRQSKQNIKCIETYDEYFANDNQSILKYWSLLHKAEALNAIGKKAEASYLYSVIFANSAEKRIRAYKLFNKDLFKESLDFAKSNDEKAGLWAMIAIGNPGPALEEIKKVIANNPQHQSIPLLIMREINKLEDWIFTPELTCHGPAISTDEHFKYWYDNFEEIKKKNYVKDINYLKEFNSYLLSISQKNSKYTAFIKLARAHLHLIAKENKEALQLFNSISTNEDKGISMQKDIELALYYAFEDKIANKKVKEKLADIFVKMEAYSQTDVSARKQLQSLSSFLSKAFLKNKDAVSAGLLKLKSERYKDAYLSKKNDWGNTDNWYDNNFYWKIAFFDRYASPKDIDQLIALIEKKNKSEFESFLCKQSLSPKNDLLDLKGTLQLRQGDLQGASNTFSSMSHDYWEKNYAFKVYLDEDPFKLRDLYGKSTGFNFNKADVLKLLIGLDKEANQNRDKAAENYLKIGHFFYNASYWGNSWMMLSYGWTSAPRYDVPYNILFGNIYFDNKTYQDAFGKCSLALKYYKRAEVFAKTNEQKAMIAFMKHKCAYNQFLWEERLKRWNERGAKYEPVFIKDLYTKYKDTEFFTRIKCPLLDYFAGK